MTTPQNEQSDQTHASLADVPERLCTWCKIPMMKRLVAGGQFVHYTCPKCIFQHTSKRSGST